VTYDREQYYYQRLEKEINKYLAEYGLMKGYCLVVSVSPKLGYRDIRLWASGYAVLHFDDRAGVVLFPQGKAWGEAHIFNDWEQALTMLAKFMAKHKYRWEISIWTGLSSSIAPYTYYTWPSRDIEKKLKGDCSG